MLKRIYVDNYKCLVNFELRLEYLALLLGPNGSGKSSVLDVVYALRQILSAKTKITDKGAFPASTLTRWQTRPVQVFEMDVETEATGPLTYRLEIEHEQAAGRARIVLERLAAPTGPLFEFKDGSVQLYRDDHSLGPSFPGDWSESWLARYAPHRDNPRPSRFLDFVRQIVVCGTYPPGIGAETRAEDPVLARDAGNFASWYRGAVQERPDLLPDYTDALVEVISGFKGLRLESVGKDARVLVVTFEERGQRYELYVDQISDGQRAAVVLYALLHLAAGQGHALFLDEPDNYVALAEIQPWLMALSDACGTTVPQVILCSHHPEMIDYLGSEHGILLHRADSGPVIARPVADLKVEDALKLSEMIARGWER
ncbi:MAG: ATP-binding protein [Deltaproteobacteria bacterium]|nr:ATP-binding protein [Deltaproteobacteria bacterium]